MAKIQSIPGTTMFYFTPRKRSLNFYPHDLGFPRAKQGICHYDILGGPISNPLLL